MNKFVALFVVSFALISQNVFGALSPYYQGVREIESILKDKRLADCFKSSDPIQSIYKEGSFYVVQGEESICMVEVIYLPSDWIGPVKFELDFSNVEQ